MNEFIALIMGLQTNGWICLGKMANPMTGKMDRSLEQAKAIIDTLLALQKRTKGNLDDDEQKVLDNAIQQLQVNFLEESKKTAEKEESSEEDPSKKDNK